LKLAACSFLKYPILVGATQTMKSKNATFSLLVVLLVLAVAVLKWRQEPDQKEAFDRGIKELQYTNNARCRMVCRKISEEDIKEIMDKGIINFSRSNRRAQPCPMFTLQGRTRDREYIQVIFSQCSEETRVLNCYNLEQDVDCPCPGNEPINE
jgi:hypothetical protein